MVWWIDVQGIHRWPLVWFPDAGSCRLRYTASALRELLPQRRYESLQGGRTSRKRCCIRWSGSVFSHRPASASNVPPSTALPHQPSFLIHRTPSSTSPSCKIGCWITIFCRLSRPIRGYPSQIWDRHLLVLKPGGGRQKLSER